MKSHRNEKGFTLIELMVVIIVTTMLSSLAIIYDHAGQSEVSLSIEAAKISQLILEAKQLSISTYSAQSTTCAYGVHFDYTNQTYSLFAYNSAMPINGSAQSFCPSYASTTAEGINLNDLAPYAGGATWQIPLPAGVMINGSSVNGDALTDVLFFPPDPITMMSRDGATLPPSIPTSKIYLQTTDGKGAETISVSPAGQVGY